MHITSGKGLFMKIILLCLILINALGFLLMRVDKYKAQNKLWRIPEATLFAVAAIGGEIKTMANTIVVTLNLNPSFIWIPCLVNSWPRERRILFPAAFNARHYGL